MIKVDALQKYENALLENFSPAVLRELKRSNWSGLLREVDRLYATMYHEWDCLQKDVTDIEDAVRSLTWTVNPKVQDGAEPEPMAKEVAKCVDDALWRRSAAAPGSVGHSFSQLLGALCHARYRGFNVHQIVWENGGDLIFPARYIQLPPQFLVWETKAGHPDRLLLVPDGMSSDGVPFPPHQYLVALNTNGPDHPLYNATFYSLVNWFVAYKFGLGWFMEYAQKYGMPKQIIRYANERERQQIVADLTDESVLNTVLLKEGGGREFDMKYPTGGASSLPQAVLLQKAEDACHKAILGQTLTSDTSANGGSLAQAKVHAGVQADVVLKVAEQVADVLNAQLIPAIVQANYGRVDGLPIPELRCKLPQAVANIERAQFLKTVMEVPGMEVKKSEAYEYLALSQPAEGDEVLKKEDPMAGGLPGMPGGMMPPPGGGGDDGAPQPPAGAPETKSPGIPTRTDEVTSARAVEGAKKADPAVAWLAPLKKKLAEARSSGASLSEIKEQISAWRPDTHALAGAMEANIKAGFFRRADAETDDFMVAKKCNQYKHKPGCKNGNITTWAKLGFNSLKEYKPNKTGQWRDRDEMLKLINVKRIKQEGRQSPKFEQDGKEFEVRKWDGRIIKIDAKTVTHVINDHIKSDGKERIENILQVIDTLEDPFEEWEQPSGAIVSLGMYNYEKGKPRAFAVVEKEHNEGRVYTFFLNADFSTLDRQRKGRLLKKKK